MLIEIADTSLDFDRGEKAELYAEAGVHEYWIVNLIDHTIEVRRDPCEGRYREMQTFGTGADVSPLGSAASVVERQLDFWPARLTGAAVGS